MPLVGKHQGSWENPPLFQGESSRSQKHKARTNLSLGHLEHMGCKTHTLQGKKLFWPLPGISCSLEAFSRLEVSDLHFALDRPHTATELATTRIIRSPREESAQAENHSLLWSWDRALLLNTMSQQAGMSSVPRGQVTDREEVS